MKTWKVELGEHVYIVCGIYNCEDLSKGDRTIWSNKFLEKIEKVGEGYFVTSGGVRNPALGTSVKILNKDKIFKPKKTKSTTKITITVEYI